jgi:hypothetical protein
MVGFEVTAGASTFGGSTFTASTLVGFVIFTSLTWGVSSTKVAC